jgi:hypothetical protein
MAKRRRRLHLILRTGFVLAFALTLVFAVRTTLSAIHWNDPANHDLPIEGWMPLGYVARSWDVPRDVLANAAGVEPGTLPRRNLEAIAEDQGIALPVLIDTLEQAISAHREASHD